MGGAFVVCRDGMLLIDAFEGGCVRFCLMASGVRVKIVCSKTIFVRKIWGSSQI